MSSQLAVPTPQPNGTQPSGFHGPRFRRIALVAVVAIVAAGSGFGLASLTSYSDSSYGQGNRSSGHEATGGADPSSTPSNDGGAFSSPSLAQSIGRKIGTKLAGQAPLTATASQILALGNQVPVGASISKSANQITFSGTSVSFTVESVPANNPDMTFRIAGLINPTIVVPNGARVSVEFINADSDQAHGWLVTSERAPFSFGQSNDPTIPNAASGLIGDPTPAGHGAIMFTFQAGSPGTYSYICPMPGHAQMGMHGTFLVR
jgi:rusticyanin